MGLDQGERDPARDKAESQAAGDRDKDEAVVMAQVRAVPVFVQAAEKKRRIRWEFPVLI